LPFLLPIRSQPAPFTCPPLAPNVRSHRPPVDLVLSAELPDQRLELLSIDDDPEISDLIDERLREYGVSVFRAFSGMQGYWMGLDNRPDAIITDLGMPDGEGNYIFGRFRSHPLTEKTPVIVLTGQTNPAIKRQMLSLGVDAYLTKPIVWTELLTELRRHITLSESAPPSASVTESRQSGHQASNTLPRGRRP
jgi:DNA-binding response OmpR family regulator